MANDTKTRKSFGNHARAAAISRFLRKHEGVATTNAGSRGIDGIRVLQENATSSVWLHVILAGQDDAAAEWAAAIADKLEANGYQVVRHDRSLTITCEGWKLDDQVGRLLFGFDGRAHLERDDMWVGMPERILRELRNAGLVKPDVLELTELGVKIRARVIAQRKEANRAEKRRLRQRGW